MRCQTCNRPNWFENYRLTSEIDREWAEASGEDRIELLGVLLHMEDRNSETLGPSIQMVFEQEQRDGDRCARSRGRAIDTASN